MTVFGAPALEARRRSSKVLRAYREPLLASSYELQARLYNILCLQFVEKYVRGDKAGRSGPAILSTMYVFAQFLGWREAIRQEVQYLHFSQDEQTRAIARLLGDIAETMLAEAYGPQFMIWRVEQRGIGERMIVSRRKRLECLGYASFIDRRDTMRSWLDPLEQDLQNLGEGGRERLTKLQHLLLELVRQLDDGKTRYPFDMREA